MKTTKMRSKSHIELRNATVEDIPEIIELSKKVYQGTGAYIKEMIRGHITNFKEGCFIITIDKKIPVNYKLLLRNDQWRIYDFSAEGISLISTYTNDFKSTLKRGGLAGLNKVLRNKVADEES